MTRNRIISLLFYNNGIGLCAQVNEHGLYALYERLRPADIKMLAEIFNGIL